MMSLEPAVAAVSGLVVLDERLSGGSSARSRSSTSRASAPRSARATRRYRSMRRWSIAGAIALVLTGAAQACPQQASPAYTARVERALRAGTDVWGTGTPSYARLSRHLHPLRFALGRGGSKLTGSGVYYLAFAMPGGPRGAGSVMLHVADGSELIAQRSAGASVFVTVGGRRFGSCDATLAGGWLPILETRDGVYRQESFAARAGGGLASFVRLDGPRLRLGTLAGSGTLYARWSGRGVVRISRAAYDAARASVVDYWQQRLAAGAQVAVPDTRVLNAERALLVQNLSLGWRYSLGNPYEEFSFPEGIDVAEVMAEWGFFDVSALILRTSLTRTPNPYPSWKMGEKLLGSATQYRLAGDRAYIRRATPALRGYLARLERQLGSNRLLARERYSSDIPDRVYGLHGQAIVWQGLRLMSGVWAETGQPALSTRSRVLAAKLERGLRRAVRSSQRRLPDGTLFVPVRLLDDETAYRSLTQERAGSYWNLVMPYALQSGLFAPSSSEARGVLRYLLRHGSRLLGLVRAGAYALYGRDARFPTGGTDQVYGKNVSRFLADLHEPEQLALSLYGQLAAGMTPGTFVAGEAASVAPLHGQWYRSMYLPPNGAANASFLETLRLMLVHETADGLELAWSTPRAWLAPGKRIEVRDLPTSFGPVSFAIDAERVSVDLPPRPPRSVRLRLRMPGATKTLDLSGLRGHVEKGVGEIPASP